MVNTVEGTRVTQYRGRLYKLFKQLYGDQARRCLNRLVMVLGRYGVDETQSVPTASWDETDAVLITYPDMLRRQGRKPLAILREFLHRYAAGAFSTVHILPFYPYSSDDGFSVIDYRTVNAEHGTWDDIQAIAQEFRLMADLILNHTSRKSVWVRDYLNGVLPALRYFIEVDPDADLARVVRPRSSELLTPIETHAGVKHLWTTFSDDQIDLNFANPDVFFEFLDILLFYVANGARLIRLDAIAYLWKQIGTSCIHLPQTHSVVKLYRAILETVAPQVLIITETNVPHHENLSYLGDGDEAHIVYQFALPPLLLHTLLTGKACRLSEWAAAVSPMRSGCTFLNFTASHDGIGVRPLEGIVSNKQIARLADQMQKRGGHISRKRNSDGSQSAYELNITYLDALQNPEQQHARQGVDRFLCSQAIMLSLKGIPAVYFHSLVGTGNDHAGVQQLGYPRAINRKKWDYDELENRLRDSRSTQAVIYGRYRNLLSIRAQHPAFHPDGAQEVLDLGNRVFAVQRTAPDDTETVIAVSNVTGTPVDVQIPEVAAASGAGIFSDLVTDTVLGQAGERLKLAAYQSCWLLVKPAAEPIAPDR